MTKKALFKIVFRINNTEMNEEYHLHYNTNEDYLQKGSTVSQSAMQAIAKDLGVTRKQITIVDVIRLS